MDEFLRRLENKGIPTTMRDTSEIDAACGPLAATKWASVKVGTRTDQVVEIAPPPA